MTHALTHVFLLWMYLHGVPDLLSVHASHHGCEEARKTASAQAVSRDLIYSCQTASIAP